LILFYLLFGLRSTYQPATWVSAEAPGIPMISITNGVHTRSWWYVRKGREISVKVEGTGTTRIDSRLLLQSDSNETVPYVLDIRLDGQRLGWFEEKTTPSRSWKRSDCAAPEPGWFEEGTASSGPRELSAPVVSERNRFEVDIPPGVHTLLISFIAPEEIKAALLRVRYLEPPEVDEE
jgi:hypothetical protein